MKTSIKTNLLFVLPLAIRIPSSGVLVDVIVDMEVLDDVSVDVEVLDDVSVDMEVLDDVSVDDGVVVNSQPRSR